MPTITSETDFLLAVCVCKCLNTCISCAVGHRGIEGFGGVGPFESCISFTVNTRGSGGAVAKNNKCIAILDSAAYAVCVCKAIWCETRMCVIS